MYVHVCEYTYVCSFLSMSMECMYSIRTRRENKQFDSPIAESTDSVSVHSARTLSVMEEESRRMPARYTRQPDSKIFYECKQMCICKYTCTFVIISCNMYMEIQNCVFTCATRMYVHVYVRTYSTSAARFLNVPAT